MGTAYSVASFDSPNDIKDIWEQAGFHLNTNGNMFRRVHQRLNIEMPNSICKIQFSQYFFGFKIAKIFLFFVNKENEKNSRK